MLRDYLVESLRNLASIRHDDSRTIVVVCVDQDKTDLATGSKVLADMGSGVLTLYPEALRGPIRVRDIAPEGRHIRSIARSLSVVLLHEQMHFRHTHNGKASSVSPIDHLH